MLQYIWYVKNYAGIINAGLDSSNCQIKLVNNSYLLYGIWMNKLLNFIHHLVITNCWLYSVQYLTLTVESAFPDTKICFFNSIPLVSDWWPIKVCRHWPVSAFHTRIDVSNDPLTICVPSNYQGSRLIHMYFKMYPTIPARSILGWYDLVKCEDKFLPKGPTLLLSSRMHLIQPFFHQTGHCKFISQ